MAYRSGSVFDPATDSRIAIDRFCRQLEDDRFRRLKIHDRNAVTLRLRRKRLVIFVFALFLAAAATGPGFLIGFVWIQRNLRWRLEINIQPHGAGSLVRWGFQSPMAQAELDERMQGLPEDQQLGMAIALLAS